MVPAYVFGCHKDFFSDGSLMKNVRVIVPLQSLQVPHIRPNNGR